MHGTHPILTCAEAGAFEAAYFAGDEAREWAAMGAAGRGVARGIVADFAEIGAWPEAARVLVLAGKGHNAGDALIAAAELCRRFLDTGAAAGTRAGAGVRVDVAWAFGERALRPLARRAWVELAGCAEAKRAAGGDGETVRVVRTAAEWAPVYDVVIDGVFGFQFRAPISAEVAALLERANGWPVRLRAAVDLPSGLGEAGAFRADFTYATGSVKAPLIGLGSARRVRFIDLGFSIRSQSMIDDMLGSGVLEGVGGLRVAGSDKRSFGHVLVVAGSRRYPGAALMAVLAALRGGAGLVTAAVPETLVPAFAARVPEAIWRGLPETPDGGLALEGFGLVREAWERATAVVIGSGLGRERETLALAADIVRGSPRPLVIDADALQAEIVAEGTAARVLTPHAGEWERIAGAVPAGAVVVRKGPVTRIETAGAGGAPAGRVRHSFFGGPVLARGGSGDLLAGLIGVMLAQTPVDAEGAAARGVVWHGMAADALARARGQVAVRTTELLDFLGPVLRGEDGAAAGGLRGSAGRAT